MKKCYLISDCGKWIYGTRFDGNVSYFPNTSYGSKAIFSCKYGYSFMNTTQKSIAFKCESNGLWNSTSPPQCEVIGAFYIV